jgi:hypothetical protein
MSGAVFIGLLLLIGTLLFEVLAPTKLHEGFQALVPVVEKDSFFSKFFPKRGDIAANLEDPGFITDKRYFNDYADVQRIGAKQDFCRMVVPKGKSEDETFFACALGGSADLSSTDFRTKSVADGFKLGRDDYMANIMKDGRYAYCRILKGLDGTWQPLCVLAGDSKFGERDVADPSPPDDIMTLLSFYDGCVIWLRLRDDMLDYVKNTQVYYKNATIDETPRPIATEGLKFNGSSEFIRIGDSSDLTLGTQVRLRSIRAFSVWVYFDEFTNNAHIFDFGNGAGKDNVFLGILGKGDARVEGAAEIRPILCGTGSTLPEGPSGAQPVLEMSPQDCMKTSSGNIDEFVCLDQEIDARKLPPSTVRIPSPRGLTNYASLHYEIWDQRQRKMRVVINNMIPLKKWTHIVVTATTSDAVRPDIGIYVDNKLVYTEPSGFLPQTSSTTNNYLGKSNWANDTSLYELRDELFKGKIFDFRAYQKQMDETKIEATYNWGKKLLGIPA